MALPPDDAERIHRWCAGQVPERLKDVMRVEADVTPRHATIYEVHAGPNGLDNGYRTPVARIRYVKYARCWTLYWSDRNGDFHEYDGIEPADDVQTILDYLDSMEDPIFWG